MRECSPLRRPRGPIFALHNAIIGCGTAESNAIAVIVGAHAGEGAAASETALEVINVRRLEVEGSRLVVAAVFVQPGNWVGIAAPVRCHRRLSIEGEAGTGDQKRKQRQPT